MINLEVTIICVSLNAFRKSKKFSFDSLIQFIFARKIIIKFDTIKQGVITTASFNNLASLALSKRKKREILVGPSGGTIDTMDIERELEIFFQTQNATRVTFTWNEYKKSYKNNIIKEN